MMLDPTPEQQRSIESGEPVPLVLNETECVVIRKEIFDRLQHPTYDDTEWTPDEMSALAEQAFVSADTAGPIQSNAH